MLLLRTNTAVTVGVLLGLWVSAVTAEIHRESAPHRCVGCATGRCQAGSPHGYWKPTWRRWPGATTYRGFKKPTPEIDVPINQVPDALDEIRINARSRSEEPLEGDAASSPLLPDMTPSDAADTPFLPTPETEVPSLDPSPLPESEPFDPTPAPPEDLFDDLMPPATDPAITPDDNLFDEFGGAHKAGTQRISQHVIRSRRPATLQAGPSTERQLPPPVHRDVADHGGPTATASGEDQPSWQPSTTTSSGDEASIALPHLVPPSEVTQASHLQAIHHDAPVAEQQQDAPAVDPGQPPTTTPRTNPLRPQSAATSAIKSENSSPHAARPAKLEVVQASAKNGVQRNVVVRAGATKRLIRKARPMNPLRQP